MSDFLIGPRVHLWLFNHPFHGVSDQVEFFVMSLRQHGIAVSVSRHPNPEALNIIIENLSQRTAQIVIDFCVATGKRVGVIMTEHIDFIDERLFIHGEPLGTHNDYMHPVTQAARIHNLLDCLPFIRCFFVLGDLPELRGFDMMCPGMQVSTIPFPQLDYIELDSIERVSPVFDCVFTGYLTSYREKLLTGIKQNLTVMSPTGFSSRKVRDRYNTQARIALNIVQRPKWHWISLMRVIAALRVGRATVSIGTADNSKISACCTQLDISDADWLERLRGYTSNWRNTYQRAHEDYKIMATAFEQDKPFPNDLFDYWAVTEDCYVE